jgi:hypothetical protein
MTSTSPAWCSWCLALAHFPGCRRGGTPGAHGREGLVAHLPLLKELVRDGFGAWSSSAATAQGPGAGAALKVLELTDGRVVAVATRRQFRHGPKTILNRGTLMVAFLSGTPAGRYGQVPRRGLRRDRSPARLTLSADPWAPPDDLMLGWRRHAGALPDLALAHRMRCLPSCGAAPRPVPGVRPDTPSASGRCEPRGAGGDHLPLPAHGHFLGVDGGARPRSS